MHAPVLIQPQTKIVTGDCLTLLRTMHDNTVHCVITSPPYFGLRDYGNAEQIGLEASPQEYIAKLVEVFCEVRRVLREDGTCWLNLGDSYARAPTKGGSGPNGKNEDRWGYGEAQKLRVVDPNSKQATNRGADLDGLPRSAKVGSSDGAVGRADRPGTRARGFRPGSGRADGIVDARGQRNRNGVGPVDGLKVKDLIGIPWRVALALQADGWYLRQDIIWHKPNPMPESVRDRCTKAHEYLFLLTKSNRYYFDSDAIAEPIIKGAAGSEFHVGKTGKHQLGRASKRPRASGNKTHKAVTEYEQSDSEEHRTKAGLLKISGKAYGTRNKRSVWTIAPKPYKEAHFATFPPALVKPCVLAGSQPGSVILDPFAGAGTVGVVAKQHGRHFVGFELNPTYADMARKRITNS